MAAWKVISNMLQDYFNKLLNELSFPLLPKDFKGESYLLELNPELSLTVKPLGQGMFLQANLCPIPDGNKEDFYMMLMKANLLGQRTGDAAIGMDSNEKSLTLSAEFPYEMEYKVFKEKIEDFANYIDYWKEEVAKWQALQQKA